MPLQYCEEDLENTLLTLENIEKTTSQLLQWNKEVSQVDDYTDSPAGIQLLAANCTLITAIGKGINRCNRITPDFLSSHFPDTPWKAIIGMRNHIAHGYFELDAEVVFDVIKNDITPLQSVIHQAIELICSKR